MGLAQDLLQIAVHLVAYGAPDPTQAALRRAISTAYYALFHLLIEDAAQRWQGSLAALTGLERAFQHGPMKSVSSQFRSATWTDWHGKNQIVPTVLQNVAKAFVDLQADRHTADYDNHRQWTVTEVQVILRSAQSAFDNWLAIRTEPIAGDYLLAMLLSKQCS